MTAAGIPAPPRGTKTAGRRLWRSVLATFDLDEHELILLRQAVHVADVCEALQAVVDSHGPLAGGKIRPALVELRQQRLLLARLIVALRVPLGDQEQHDAPTSPAKRLQRRATRGFYGIKGGVAS